MVRYVSKRVSRETLALRGATGSVNPRYIDCCATSCGYCGGNLIKVLHAIVFWSLAAKAVNTPKPECVGVVRYGNYEPAEVDSIWTTEEAAKKRCNDLGGMWDVVSWWLDVHD